MNFQTEKLSRRRMIGLLGGATAAAATGSLFLNTQGAMAAGGPFEVIAEAHLVTTPNEASTTIRVLEVGEQVTNLDPLNPEMVNGFRHVRTAYNEVGWIVRTYLQPVDAPPQDPIFDAIRFVTVEEPLLSDAYGVEIATLPFGSQVEASDIREGEYIFVKVWLTEGETYGWVRNWLLTPEGVKAFTVNLPELTGVVPLLAEPNNPDTWIADVPHGANALDYDGEIVEEHRGVETEFGTGWIYQGYLGVG